MLVDKYQRGLELVPLSISKITCLRDGICSVTGEANERAPKSPKLGDALFPSRPQAASIASEILCPRQSTLLMAVGGCIPSSTQPCMEG